MNAVQRTSSGFSLIELVITVAVLAILTLGVLPLTQVSVQRQREQELREALRQMREAIDQFHREALAAPQQSNQLAQQQQNQRVQPGQQPAVVDPRIRVYVSDQKIFAVDNFDRFPPDLETLVKGVSVMPLASSGLGGGRGDPNVKATDVGSPELSEKTKIYLRKIPIDPMTQQADWVFVSCYQSPEDSWDGVNVFNVHSKSKGKALNGENYSDW